MGAEVLEPLADLAGEALGVFLVQEVAVLGPESWG
jgi:hypothetical protein